RGGCRRCHEEQARGRDLDGGHHAEPGVSACDPRGESNHRRAAEGRAETRRARRSGQGRGARDGGGAPRGAARHHRIPGRHADPRLHALSNAQAVDQKDHWREHDRRRFRRDDRGPRQAGARQERTGVGRGRDRPTPDLRHGLTRTIHRGRALSFRSGSAGDHDRPTGARRSHQRPGGGRVSATMTGIDFIAPIRTELEDFEQRLHATVRADLGPVAEAMEQILEAGGKRLRPALVFLAAGLGTARRMDDIHRAAMAIEFIHNATLIHADLIDGAPTRRWLRTIHETLGPNPAIIIGDYYFAKGANLMSQIGNTSIDALLSSTVMTICFGEMLQLTSQRRYDQTLDEYYAKIERKTAVLLAASTFCGAVLGDLPESQVQAIRRFGRLLGMSFQIADDVLDYLASEEEVGKPVGNDLKQGTVTLPLMLARHDPSLDGQLDAILGKPLLQDADYAEVVRIVRGSRGIDESYEY